MTRLTLQLASVLVLASVLGACTTSAGGDGPAPIRPTARFGLEARPAQQEVALAQRPDGLSQAQRAALGDIAARSEGKPIVIRSPSTNDPVAVRSAFNAKEALERMGAGDVRMASYDGQPGAPILVGFTSFEAVIPQCGVWNNLGATRDNQTQSNFGCAITANMAAQIRDPADLVSPQPMDPADASRRSTVMTKYRAGEVTSAARDNTSSGAVSRVVP